MKTLRLFILAFFTVGLICSCTFVSNTFKYRDRIKEFTESLLQKNYDQCVQWMAMDHSTAVDTKIDTLKTGLASFREVIVSNFGDQLDYRFMSAEKKWSNNTSESTAPNTTKVQMQFSNQKEFGILEVLFDDRSQKILDIKTLDIKEAIPNMAIFWIVGLLALCVPVFNIYMIVRIKRSQYKRKWLKYLAIVVLNVPSLTYKAIGGLSLGLFNFQIFFGISFVYMGYLNAAWAVGLPLGGLYLLWQLRQGKDKAVEVLSDETFKFEEKETVDSVMKG